MSQPAVRAHRPWSDIEGTQASLLAVGREDYPSEGMGAVLSRSGRVDPKSRRGSAASSRKDSRESVSRRRSSGGQTPTEGRIGEQLRLPSTHSTGNYHGSPKEHKNHHGQKTSAISPQMVSSPAGRSPVAISNLQQARLNMITDGLTETYLVRCLLFGVRLFWPSHDVLSPFGVRHTRDLPPFCACAHPVLDATFW